MVVEVGAVDGALHLTCRNGFRQVGAPKRVADLVAEIASALGREAGDVAVSARRTDPPWAPVWPRTDVG
ncbi:hypothetical protein [Cellulomonas triticagri]|uniref:Uncharacterized protein n=1 Tax=Cellulomonas triticagri TaxID=2483352 RepID=A0A3M2J4Z6_9CELL|nr:hypothetical protein [Cellulomonas triticagri]RMI09162.1 hypothetical protein EBM89_11475 [Cellulomonas triticagri]